jgi:tRNA modification GTPase
LEGAAQGELLRRGLRVVLAGRPNTGKSSLLNALLGRERALVHAQAGTTRDWIEETLLVDGFAVVLTDTAGLRQAEGAVEQEGVARAARLAQDADLRLLVLDASQGLQAGDLAALAALGAGPCWAVWNKADLSAVPAMPVQGCQRSLAVSALRGDGLEALKQALRDHALQGAAASLGALLVTHTRQHDALRRSQAARAQAEAALAAGAPAELVCVDLREALDGLDELCGSTTRREVLEAIFKRFCVGK